MTDDNRRRHRVVTAPMGAHTTRRPAVVPAARSGMTLIELLVSMTISGVIISVGLTFMAPPDTVHQSSLDRMSALRSARYAVTLLSQDIESLGTNGPGAQPVLIHADANVVTFSRDGAAGTLSFSFMSDSSTSRSDDFVLYRRVDGAARETVARHLIRDGDEPFFSFEQVAAGSGGEPSIEALPASLLPIHGSEPPHMSPADTASSAMESGIRALGVTLIATNGLVGDDERSVRVERRIVLPNAGKSMLGACGSPPASTWTRTSTC